MHGSQARSARNHRPGRDWGRHGLTVIEVLVIIAVVAVLGVLGSGWMRVKGHPMWFACANNLRSIGSGFSRFAADHRGAFPPMVSTNEDGSMEYGPITYQHFYAARIEIGIPKMVCCPADPRRMATNMTGLRNANLSYFVSLDATPNRPDMVLSGHRNFMLDRVAAQPGMVSLVQNQKLGWTSEFEGHRMHLLFADGSVRPYRDLRLTTNHLATHLVNRLAVP